MSKGTALNVRNILRLIRKHNGRLTNFAVGSHNDQNRRFCARGILAYDLYDKSCYMYESKMATDLGVKYSSLDQMEMGFEGTETNNGTQKNERNRYYKVGQKLRKLVRS